MNTLTGKKILFLFIGLFLISSSITIITKSITYGLISISLIMGIFVIINDLKQTKHAILRNYPLIGRLRGLFEEERSKIQQYFIEHDTNGTPYNREKRSDVYQKAKKELNTTPFGSQLDMYKSGYEFLPHSMFPKDISEVETPRVTIGSSLCKKPYSASIFNISV